MLTLTGDRCYVDTLCGHQLPVRRHVLEDRQHSRLEMALWNLRRHICVRNGDDGRLCSRDVICPSHPDSRSVSPAPPPPTTKLTLVADNLIETDAFGNVHVVGKVGDANINNTTGPTAQSTSLESVVGGYEPRSWANDMKLFRGATDWSQCWTCYRNMLKAAVLPNIAWVVILNSICIAVMISYLTTFSQPLMVWQKGGAWAVDNLGLSTLAMLPACFFSFIASGWDMDWISKYMAKRNGGIHEVCTHTHPS